MRSILSMRFCTIFIDMRKTRCSSVDWCATLSLGLQTCKLRQLLPMRWPTSQLTDLAVARPAQRHSGLATLQPSRSSAVRYERGPFLAKYNALPACDQAVGVNQAMMDL